MLVESLLLIKKHKKKPWLNLLLISGRLHKDIFLAQRLAEKIEKKLPGNLVINAGVHIDGIFKEQIDDSFIMTDELAEKILAWVKEESSGFKNPKYTTHLERDASGKLI